MSDPTEEAVIAEAVAGAKAKHAAASAAKTEEEKWNAKRTVTVTAVTGPRKPSDPNASKHKHYWVPGHRIEINGAPLESEFTEREIHGMKQDPYVHVDDPNDEAQQETKRQHALSEKTKALENAKALLAHESPAEPVKPTGVAPAAVEALSELKASKKHTR